MSELNDAFETIENTSLEVNLDMVYGPDKEKFLQIQSGKKKWIKKWFN